MCCACFLGWIGVLYCEVDLSSFLWKVMLKLPEASYGLGKGCLFHTAASWLVTSGWF